MEKKRIPGRSEVNNSQKFDTVNKDTLITVKEFIDKQLDVKEAIQEVKNVGRRRGEHILVKIANMETKRE